MTDLLAALGLAIAIEGILYALFPDRMKRMMAQVLGQPDAALRAVGLVAACVGVVIVWLARG
ncbi:MAG: DUF2065 domain-containing protein [Rhodospirillales bacterium]|nr:DUF2065 domain-containing protein [Rhodospirillales bacterium]MCW8862778.1 DUF2065 domain-containing protein [Rhodospirillales bacterium]MCW8952097.1 DUF2065 domain-containing protein [Rhodospirillales bacterium]MCW8971068.1 DUF2065 domain-containing protein [Rhodospirillales bacterium]MCW9002921.1 DUF2065 domain-containing protein [Rhodospirillales bacterium]